MKKLTLLLACIMVFASIASVCVSASDVSYTAVYAANAPIIDGKADDAIWATATKATIASPMGSNTGTATAPTFKIAHDGTYIFFLVEYTDPNGTIEGNGYVDAVNGKNNQPVGNDYVWFAFNGAEQASYVFNAPKDADGAVSMNLYHSNLRKWHCNMNGSTTACGGKQVNQEEEGPRAVSIRTAAADGTSKVVWELRLPKAVFADLGDSIAMEIYFNDAAIVGGEDKWTIEAFSWCMPENWGHWEYIDTVSNYGTLKLAAAPTDAGNTEDTTAKQEETTTAKQEETTTAKQEETTTAKQEQTTTANEPANTGSTTTPTTADAGLAIAAVVMACAAMIVLKKKH